MQYRPEIDGLRAMAVLPVVLFHAGIDGFHGGYVGVDVFFVISGYLITTILLHDLDREKFSLLKFYERRARRILPALFVMLIATTIFAPLWMHPVQLRSYADALLATSIFGSNFYFMSVSTYFHPTAEMHPLLHTWSLAVEEQFYIFFPFVLWALFTRAKRSLFWCLAALTVLSLVGSAVLLDRRPEATFYMLPTRAWELGVGVLCALWLIPVYRPTRWQSLARDGAQTERPVIAFIGLLLIAASVVLYDSKIPFPGIAALPPVLGTALIILFAGHQGVASRILRAKPVVAIGLLSYSAYLWHQPLFAFARIRSFEPPSIVLMLFLAAFSFVLAALSLRYVERPFRVSGPGVAARATPGALMSRSAILSGSAVSILLFVAVSLGLAQTEGWPQRWAARIPKGYSLENASRVPTWKPLRAIDPTQWPSGGGFEHDWFSASDKPGLLLLGNSHSKDAYNIFAASDVAPKAFAIGRVGMQTMNLAGVKKTLASRAGRDADIFVLSARYKSASLEEMAKVLDLFAQERRPVVLILNTAEFFGNSDSQIADKLFMYSNLAQQNDNQESLVAQLNASYHRYEDRDVQERNVKLRALAEARGITVMDRRDLMCDDAAQSCTIIGSDFTKFLADYGHPTMAGAAYYAAVADKIDWFAPLKALVAD